MLGRCFQKLFTVLSHMVGTWGKALAASGTERWCLHVPSHLGGSSKAESKGSIGVGLGAVKSVGLESGPAPALCRRVR